MIQTMSKNPETSLPPGFRFHPTDEELILYYLRNKVTSIPCPVSIIAEVDIYKFDPWELPAQAAFGEKEWYFFSPRDRKYPNGARPNRAAASGYWKATGTDKPIRSTVGKENIGVKKALVFYRGRPPKGVKTNWIMHEYRLAEAPNRSIKPMRMKESSMRLDDWVLCRIYKKNLPLPTPSVVYRGQEDHSIEVGSRMMLPNVANQGTLELPKSSSFSDLLAGTDFSLLSRLLSENPSDSASSEFSSVYTNANLNQPMINSNNSYLHQKLPQQQSSVLSSENRLNRQQPVALSSDEGVLQHTSKKLNTSCNFTNITNQLETPQYNLLDQAFFNQQILLNSHLQFQ